MAGNKNLAKAKKAKNDEFYTRLATVETEISMHEDYVKHFEGKTVFCNCDDPQTSGFFKFFVQHFQQLKMEKLITTHYNKDHSPSYKLEWKGEICNGAEINLIKTDLEGDGDFRSNECIELLQEADIVVTNPPFSLFIEYIQQLVNYKKEFIIIGNKNAIPLKEIFPLLKDNKMWLGYTIPSDFMLPNGEISKKQNGLTRWYTNLDLDKCHEEKELTHNYAGQEDRYPKYENYDAINVDKVDEIPRDYYGVIGVPITFMDIYDPNQFELLECHEPCISLDVLKKQPKFKEFKSRQIMYNGKLCQKKYHRLFIRRKNEEC